MRAQIEGGLHDATLDKSPGAGLAWATAWNGYNLARLHREAWPNPAWMEQVDNTVYERYNPVPLWTAYPYQTYWVPPPDSPAPSASRTRARAPRRCSWPSAMPASRVRGCSREQARGVVGGFQAPAQ